jgi:PAS domain S-box-containing protein
MTSQAQQDVSALFEVRGTEQRAALRLLPVLILGAALVLEVTTTGVRITPALLTVGLAAIAPLLPPLQVLGWSAVFFAATLASLLFVYNGGQPDPPSVVALRSIAFLVVAVLAYKISCFQASAIRQAQGLLQLFDKLGSPIVISDADGNITFANRACCELVGLGRREMMASTFSSLFSHPESRGRSIEQYLALFDPQQPPRSRLHLAVRGQEGYADLTGSCTMLDVNGTKLLVTQLERDEP